jgi:hypothetical protein
MQIVKGDQKWYPVPGVVTRPPCPRGYKYSGLALQVGGRVTGQQPVTIINCYETYNVTLEKTKWNRSRQWKRINEMRKATCNVFVLYRAGAMKEMVKEMGKYKTDICALQEIRWPEKRTVIKKNCTILYSGHKSYKHVFGTGFYINRHIMDNLLDFESVNEIICKIMVKHKYYNLALISTHAPNEDKDEVAKKNFIVLWRMYVMQFSIMT